MRLTTSGYVFVGSSSGNVFVPSAAMLRHKQLQLFNGTLTDPSGAAIPGAIISRSRSRSSAGNPRARSGAEGKYSLALSPGRYRVTIQSTSFARVEQEISLRAGETRRWDVRLELELLSSHVVVTRMRQSQRTLETTAALADVITREDIDERQQMFLTPTCWLRRGPAFRSWAGRRFDRTFFSTAGIRITRRC